ncbi:MAG TPA: crosslink repair DNA glycosylase YcaQ family protein, partial [Micromonosporaceae bacterium]|nr:crosslink repair DNA glycosylase YcaQ family protein [Micromonosporaceae bacterium]
MIAARRGSDRLDPRTLNRATLDRQLPLRRHDIPALDAVRHLVGLQAQLPNPPYLGLWTRLADFAHEELSALIHDRQVVRAVVLRATQHLVTAPDFLFLRPLLQPVLDRGRQAAMGRATAGMDLAELAEVGRSLLGNTTLTRPQIRELLAQRWPDRSAEALSWSVQYLLPLVSVPPGITWRKGGVPSAALGEYWLGRPVLADPSPVELV